MIHVDLPVLVLISSTTFELEKQESKQLNNLVETSVVSGQL